MKNKIAIILGTRPNFVKIYPLILFLEKENKLDNFILIYTQQHYSKDLIPEIEKIKKIKIDFLKLKKNKVFDFSICINELIFIYKKFNINKVIIIGDSDTTLSGAISAKRSFLKLFHIESGLRSFNYKMHEEFNRITSAGLADVCFAPSKKSYDYLKYIFKKTHQKAYFVGDLNYNNLINYFNNQITSFKKKLNNPFILLTLHRRENILYKRKLKSIFQVLNNIGKNFEIKFYCHPHTLKKIKEFKIKLNFKILKSIPNLKLLNEIRNSNLVITDSGGMQKEAFYLKKYCVVLRDQTEWFELSKLNSYVGYEPNKIYKFIKKNFFIKYKMKNNPYHKKNNLKIITKKILNNDAVSNKLVNVKKSKK